VRAAVYSGGVSIIVLAATGRHRESNTVSLLSGSVTTARSDVDLIATEHGVAQLRGLSLRQRIRAMIAIAAPEHRVTLLRAARQIWSDL